ncbi:hypothetical protein [Terrarubrum flagellatum]|uniref:hypothetical protein n=1 Tax=Terrirubrum flagellatum TaxID=2895980 RepID=UPI003144FAC3
MSAEMHIYRDTWAFDEKVCPCDAHLMEFIADRDICDAAIYHFGTGGHHLVGLRCSQDGRNNSVLAITASPTEYDEYVKLLIANPKLARTYIAYFGDIYMLNEKLMPRFDVVTLFHSREFRSEKNDAYGALTDLDVMKLLAGRANPGGHILFYTGSFAYSLATADIDALKATGAVEEVGMFKTLRVFRRTDKAI